MSKLTTPPVPCGSCPYRQDVPAGIWERHEYDKLPSYDGDTSQQSPALFLCHQRDGNICGGWLACHGPDRLLAMRFAAITGSVDVSAFDYQTDVPVFRSGAEARAHGISGIERPDTRAAKMISGLLRTREAQP
jgi:hypothetical protein